MFKEDSAALPDPETKEGGLQVMHDMHTGFASAKAFAEIRSEYHKPPYMFSIFVIRVPDTTALFMVWKDSIFLTGWINCPERRKWITGSLGIFRNTGVIL